MTTPGEMKMDNRPADAVRVLAATGMLGSGFP